MPLPSPRLAALLLLSLASLLHAQTAPSSGPAALNPGLPTLWLVGDSTINNNARGGQGWGTPLAKLLNPAKINLVNRARGGRSARSYLSEGLWDGPNGVLPNLKPGDIVLIQFGHNDAGASPDTIAKTANGRPDLPGTGDETATGPASIGGKEETVHSYGWYLAKYVTDAKSKGALPILLTMVPHNRFDDTGKVRRNTTTFTKWAKDVAAATHTPLIDLNNISAARLETESPQAVTEKYFTPPNDGTHTNPAGAALNAQSVIMGLRTLHAFPIDDVLSDTAKSLPRADPSDIQPAK